MAGAAATASPNNTSLVHHPDELRVRSHVFPECSLTRFISAAKLRTGACCRASVKLLVLPLNFQLVDWTLDLVVRHSRSQSELDDWEGHDGTRP